MHRVAGSRATQLARCKSGHCKNNNLPLAACFRLPRRRSCAHFLGQEDVMGAAPSLQKLGPQTTATPTQNVGGQSIYLNGEYLTKNPLWHLEESAWKAAQITRMLQKNQISPLTVCDVGCGAGEVLRQLQKTLASDCKLYGYDVSPQAIDLAAGRANERLHFCLEDFCTADGVWFDLLLALDVLEHVEDYFGFLRQLKAKGRYKIFHIPL